MILEDIADGADVFVESASAAYAEPFRHRDLHAVDVCGVPDRLQKRVSEPEVQEVLYRLLPEKMIDTVHSQLGERFVEGRVQSLRGRKVTPERFFHDDTGLRRTSRLCEAACHGAKQTRRDRQIKQRPCGRAQ